MFAVRWGIGAVLVIVVSAVVFGPRAASGAEAQVSAAEVRAAIERSLPFVEAGGVAWIEERKCVSCHRVGVMTWALGEAAARGFPVEAAKLDEWIDWSLAKSLAENEMTGEPAGSTNLDGVAQLLLGRKPGAADAARNASYRELVTLLVDGQRDDGSWKPAGQLPGQKRPQAETESVSTIWNTLALMRNGESTVATQAAVERSAKRVADASGGESTEWYATRLLLATENNNDDVVVERARCVEQLSAKRNEDGGWGWITGDASDALGTGLAIYALRQAGMPSDDPVIQSGLRFLLDSQQDDGSWPVRGTKEKKKDGIEETATYWGTAWATIAMLETLP